MGDNFKDLFDSFDIGFPIVGLLGECYGPFETDFIYLKFDNDILPISDFELDIDYDNGFE